MRRIWAWFSSSTGKANSRPTRKCDRSANSGSSGRRSSRSSVKNRSVVIRSRWVSMKTGIPASSASRIQPSRSGRQASTRRRRISGCRLMWLTGKAGKLQRQPQILHAAGKAYRLDLQPAASERLVQQNDIPAVGVMRADPVETRLADHRDILVECALEPVRVPALHGPERLEDQQLLGHAARALFSSILRLTFGSASAAGEGLTPAAISSSASLISLARLLPMPRPAAATRRPSSR